MTTPFLFLGLWPDRRVLRVNLVTHGFVVQVYDTETNEYEEQYFVGGKNVVATNALGEDIPFDHAKLTLLPYEMKQPNVLLQKSDSESTSTDLPNYLGLYQWIERMNNEQLKATVTVHLHDNDEFVAVRGMLLNDAEQDDDRIDDGHPYLAIY